MKQYKMILDKRYTISKEWCGYYKPMYIIRFCDDYIGSSHTLDGANSIQITYEAGRA